MAFTPQTLPDTSGTLVAHWAARLESYNDDDAVGTMNAQSGTSRDATTPPGDTPTGGGVLYVEGGATPIQFAASAQTPPTDADAKETCSITAGIPDSLAVIFAQQTLLSDKLITDRDKPHDFLSSGAVSSV